MNPPLAGADDATRLRIGLVYWGRRGLPRFVLELARALDELPDAEPVLSIARGNELFDAHGWLADRLVPVQTFGSALGVVTSLPRLPAILRATSRQLTERRVRVVVVLMSHLWTPLLAPALRRAGLAYVVVVHDATAHPGDLSALANRWLLRDLRFADRVVTLSAAVADRLVADGRVESTHIARLWLPDYSYATAPQPDRQGPLRLLFFGRILPYKGLGLLVEAAERLAAAGVAVRLGVFGTGDLGGLATRLQALGAEVANRWIGEGEVGGVLRRHDVVVLPYVEASQSGVIAAAHGAGLPVVVTPVGGLVEQVEHGTTGLVAAATDAAALTATLRTMVERPELLERLRAGVAAGAAARSVDRFARALVDVAWAALSDRRQDA